VRIPFVLILFMHIPVAAAVAQMSAALPPTNNDAAAQQSAASSAIPVTALTIAQALELADRNSPLLQEAQASVDRASAGIQTAKAYTNPSVDFQGGHQSARHISTPGVPGALLRYGASQTLEIPRERRSRVRAAEFDFIGSEHRLAGIRLSVAAEVKRAFYDVIRRKEQLTNARDNLVLVEDLRRRVRLEVEVGEKGRLELTRAEAELARAQASIRSADVELANSRAILKAVIGSTSEDTFDADGSLGHPVQLPVLGDIRQLVTANHPALSEANALTLRARSVVEHERALRIPGPTFSGEYEHQPDITFYRFGVSVPLPLWNRRKGPIAEAKSEVNRSEASARQRRLEIVAALERAYDQYQISNQQVEGLQAGSLREAQAAVEAAQSAYKFGERGIVEVLDAQRVLQGVRGDLLDALYARQSALIDLEGLGVTHQ
jgi:cobalt-zinc-cadmium efflux system outer membrane protein